MYISETEFRKRLAGDLYGAYVLFGEEDYLKAYCIKAAREAICPDEGLACFNDITVDFPDFSVDALTDALAAPPMMADRKLVVLRSFNFGAIKASEVEGLLALLAAHREDRDNLLLISVIPEGLDVGFLPKKPSALYKKLDAVATTVRFETSSPASLRAWAARHFKHEGVEASGETIKYLVDYAGHGMYNLASEIHKLCAYLHSKGRDTVTKEDIDYITVPEEECDAFALSDAALAGDRARALSVLSVMKFRRVKPEYVLFEIMKLYCDLYQIKRMMACGAAKADMARILRLHEYRVGLYMNTAKRTPEATLSRAVSLCRDADRAMKSYAKKDYEQIEKLICLL